MTVSDNTIVSEGLGDFFETLGEKGLNFINYWHWFDYFTIIGWNSMHSIVGNKVLHKMIINEYNKYKKQYEKDQRTIKSFENIYRKY